MHSLWQLTSPYIPTDEFEAGHADAVVVGAGLTGLTTAVLLARSGMRVTVLEAREVGALTTGNTTGKLSLLQGTVFSEIRERCGDEVLDAYAEANREGQAWLLRQLDSWGVPVQRRAAFTYAAEPSTLGTLEREREAAASVGIDVQSIDDPSDAAQTGLPFEIAGALTLPDQAQLHPMVVLAELAKELHSRGGRLVENCRVCDVEQSEGGVEVGTDLGLVFADVCVLATGTPVLDRGLLFAKLEPSRSFVSAYKLPAPASPPRGMYVCIDSDAHSLRTAEDSAGDELLVVGGGAHITGRADDTQELLQRIDTWAHEHFSPGAAAPERVTWWAAQDYRSHSRVPFAGPLPRGGGRIYTATAFNKWGMTNGVAAALTIAADILGGHLEWARTLREHSTRLSAMKDALESTAAVAARLASGWAFAEVRPAGSVEQLAEGEGRVVSEGLMPVAESCVDGRLCRVSAVCPHMGGILEWNTAERSWDCPLHGSRFTHDGTRLEGPAVDDLRRK